MSKTQIITGVERRRKFSDEEKSAMVAETMDSKLSVVARKYGIATSVLHRWKKQFPASSFALLEVKDADVKQSKPSIPPSKQVEPSPEISNSIRVILQKNIVVEFPMTADPWAIAQFIKTIGEQ